MWFSVSQWLICNDFITIFSKSVVSKERLIKTISQTLQHCSALNAKCAMDLIKLLEELGKFSISAMELKDILWLLREEENFDYRKQLLQVTSISVQKFINQKRGQGVIIDQVLT